MSALKGYALRLSQHDKLHLGLDLQLVKDRHGCNVTDRRGRIGSDEQ